MQDQIDIEVKIRCRGVEIDAKAPQIVNAIKTALGIRVSKPTPADIARMVCEYMNISMHELISKQKLEYLNEARYLYCYACRKFTTADYIKIAQLINRHRASAYYQETQYENWLSYNQSINKQYKEFCERFNLI